MQKTFITQYIYLIYEKILLGSNGGIVQGDSVVSELFSNYCSQLVIKKKKIKLVINKICSRQLTYLFLIIGGIRFLYYLSIALEV